MIVAAIDVGTNSIRLLVAEINGVGELTVLDRFRVPLRLGRRLNPESGYLDKRAIDDTVAALLDMKLIAKRHRADVVRAVCTHAIRASSNASEIINRLKNHTKLDIEIIDGKEEARLSGLAMIIGLKLKGSVLGVDVGGGSTDFSYYENGVAKKLESIPLGVVSLSGFMMDPSTVDQHIKKLIDPIEKEWKQLPFDVAACCSGSAKTVAYLHQGLKKNNGNRLFHNYVLTREDVRFVLNHLMELRTPKAISTRWRLSFHRAQLALAGAKIFYHLGEALDVKEWRVSAYGLREGIVLDVGRQILSQVSV